MIEYQVVRGFNTSYLAPKINPLGEEGYRVQSIAMGRSQSMQIALVKDDYSVPTTDYIATVVSQISKANEFINTNLANGYKLDGVCYGEAGWIGVLMHKEYDPVKEYVLVDTPNGEWIDEHIQEKASEGFILEEIHRYGTYAFTMALMKRLK